MGVHALRRKRTNFVHAVQLHAGLRPQLWQRQPLKGRDIHSILADSRSSLQAELPECRKRQPLSAGDHKRQRGASGSAGIWRGCSSELQPC